MVDPPHHGARGHWGVRLKTNITSIPGLAGIPDVAGVPEPAGDHLNAHRFLLAFGHRVRRSPELGRWYIWNGSWWEEDRLDRVLELAGETIDQLREWVAEAVGDEFRRRSAHYNASAKAGRRDALL